MAEEKPVLLVEDNIVNQKVALILLDQLGLKADVVDNGHKAVDKVMKNSYKVILMDCQMPEMDGFEATKAIRKRELANGTYTPIVAVTALAMVGDRERCIAAGMDDYIPKPIDKEILKIKLNHWMQKESVVQNQMLAAKVISNGHFVVDRQPINLTELEDYYGRDELHDVLRTFIVTTERLLSEIETAIADHKDFPLAHMAHELKASSASIGAKGMAMRALYLERAAGMRDWKDARDSFQTLETSFSEIKNFVGWQIHSPLSAL